MQLLKKLKEISVKVNFSFSTNKTTTGDSTIKEIEEALNICSMNISIMRKRLEDFKTETEAEKENLSIFKKLFQSSDRTKTTDSILEHCRLVILFLESRVGRITEDLETHKTRKKNRDRLLYEQNRTIDVTYKDYLNSNQSTNNNTISSTNTNNTNDNMLLQVENTRMIEEMSRGLFETLSSTETQILEISRLQSTLQSHLTMQHDLTCRLFDDSVTTVQETQKGNEYLKRTGKESSTMRKFLVTLILLMSLLLLLLHYFNK